MAAIDTQKEIHWTTPPRGNRPGLGRKFERYWATSDTATAMTSVSETGAIKKLLQASMTFSGSFTGTVTIERISGLGSQFDQTIETINVVAKTRVLFRALEETLCLSSDHFKITITAMAAVISRVEYLLEAFEDLDT